MNIGLVYIPPENERFNRSFPSFPPLGIGYISAYLNKNGKRVKVYDITSESDEWLTKQLYSDGVELVGFSVFSWNAPTFLRVAEKIKEENKDVTVIVGGPEPSYNPDKYFDLSFIDGVIRGEGETAFRKLAERSNKINILGVRELYTRQNKSPIQIIRSLKKIPSPYLEKIFKTDKYHIFSFQTHRGCSKRCSFCRWQYPGSIRYYDLKQIVDELEYLSSIPNLYVLQCIDADFLHNPKYAAKILEELAERRVRFPQVNFELNYESFNSKIGKLMSKVGESVLAAYGLETASEKVQRTVNKVIDLSEFKNKIRETKKCGLKVQINLLLGLPYQNWDTVEETIEYTRELEPDRVVVNTVYWPKDEYTNKVGGDFYNLPPTELEKAKEKIISILKKGF